jgi:ribosomal protein S18 acetylase RimI-like enzyme
LALDDSDAFVHIVLARTRLHRGEFERAEQSVARALTLNPNHAEVVVQAALWTALLGDAPRALTLARRAMELDPRHRDWFHAPALWAHFLLGDFAAAMREGARAGRALVDLPAYEEFFPRFADALGGRAFAYGTADGTADLAGTALGLPPSVTPDEESVMTALATGLPAERRAEVLEILEQLAPFHPDGPHWYLPLIGVAPARQGRGLGALLLRHALARCDAEHLPAYLESTNPANVPLYERHGFRVVGTVRSRSSPTLRPMVRPPRPS